jgi:hypothetical protein
MTKTSFVMRLVWLVGVLLIGFAGTARADHPWSAMQGSQGGQTPSNPPTVDAAQQQCLNARAADPSLTTADCNEFADMLRSGQCTKTSVPDGTVHSWLGGRGASITVNRTKALGGDTPALACALSNGQTLVWYHQSVLGTAACNNVAPLPQPRSQLQSLQTARPQMSLQPEAPQVITSGGVAIPSCCVSCDFYAPYATPLSQTVIPTNPTATFIVPGGQPMN